MKFFFDHDVPNHLKELLERHGHKVSLVKEVMRVDASDEEVFQHAIRNKAIMVTCNRNDFLCLAELHEHVGLIILIRRRTALSEAGHLLELLRNADVKGLYGNINFA